MRPMVSNPHRLPDLYVECGQVPVSRRQVVAAIKLDHLAAAPVLAFQPAVVTVTLGLRL